MLCTKKSFTAFTKNTPYLSISGGQPIHIESVSTSIRDEISVFSARRLLISDLYKIVYNKPILVASEPTISSAIQCCLATKILSVSKFRCEVRFNHIEKFFARNTNNPLKLHEDASLLINVTVLTWNII